MASLDPGLFSLARMLTFLGSILVSLSSGTNYVYSAFAPQLGTRLYLSHTQLNIIGIAGNLGSDISGPVWGRIVDSKGNRIPLIGAFTCLLTGYLGIKRVYDDGAGGTGSSLRLVILILCKFMTGMAGSAGISVAINTTAKSFPGTVRGTTTGLVISGFGLSAFFFATIASIAFPGDTSAFLFILALGTAIPMLLGLVIVRQIPLPPTSSERGVEGELPGRGGYHIPSSETTLFIGENGSRAPLLDPTSEHEQEVSNYHVPESLSAVGLLQDRSISRGSRTSRRVSREKPMHDIYGRQLWLTPDFYLLFTIVSILSGIGIMYINNVGSISKALYAKGNPNYDELEASQWQATQVSTLSVCNFAGRILIGLIADFTQIRLRLPRVYCLCLISVLFVVSQVSAINVTEVANLWKATALLGLAYGSLMGICPAIIIDWFGLAHLSENWGYVLLSSSLGGNIFSLMFGHNLDAHAPNDDSDAQLPLSLVRRADLPSDHQCFDGRDCYVSSLYVTVVACLFALGLSVWAGMRDQRKTTEAQREVVWEADE